MYRLLPLLLWLPLSTVLHAAVFKCISPAGQHSYQDQPCPADHVAHAMRGSYFSQISREPYQLEALKRQQQQQRLQQGQLQREQGAQRKAQQQAVRQRQQALKHCQRLQRQRQTLTQQVASGRSARQTQRLQERLASQQQALQDAGCIP